jgi:Zn-dependent protease
LGSVNFNNLNDYRKGLIFVSAAGITANILLAFFAQLIFSLLRPEAGNPVSMVLFYFFRINIMLAAFNLIPIPPLDGSKILMGFTSRNFQYSLSRLEPYGFFIILGLLYLGLLDGLIGFLQGAIASLIGFVVS